MKKISLRAFEDFIRGFNSTYKLRDMRFGQAFMVHYHLPREDAPDVYEETNIERGKTMVRELWVQE